MVTSAAWAQTWLLTKWTILRQTFAAIIDRLEIPPANVSGHAEWEINLLFALTYSVKCSIRKSLIN